MLMRQWRVDVDLEHREVGVPVDIDEPGWTQKIDELNAQIGDDWERAMTSFRSSLVKRYQERNIEVTIVEVF